ncbi:MAG: ectoine utilization protein EutC [Alphaproteobacteria bacterium]|nr:ectoine utilization protein EutC [Alphaproteobacteria bacterium]
MPNIKIVTEAELRSHVGLDLDTVKCVEEAFAALAGGEVVMPPIMSLDIKRYNGEVDVKTAYVPGVDSFAIKMSGGFFDNPKIGLPSLGGLMVLFSSKTGVLEALLLDNGYLTDIRTAAAGAVVAKNLARDNANAVTLIGGGLQARLQLEALCLVRPVTAAKIWARNCDQAEAAARELAEKLSIEVTATTDAAEAVGTADIVVTTTPATQPLVKSDWLRPGQLVIAMGSDNTHKNEVEAAALAKADLFVCDRQSQCERLGELHHAIEAGVMSGETDYPELGQIVAGAHPGRSSDDQLIVCDLTGTGVQDTAIATLAFARCLHAGAGQDFDS